MWRKSTRYRCLLPEIRNTNILSPQFPGKIANFWLVSSIHLLFFPQFYIFLFSVLKLNDISLPLKYKEAAQGSLLQLFPMQCPSFSLLSHFRPRFCCHVLWKCMNLQEHPFSHNQLQSSLLISQTFYRVLFCYMNDIKFQKVFLKAMSTPIN